MGLVLGGLAIGAVSVLVLKQAGVFSTQPAAQIVPKPIPGTGLSTFLENRDSVQPTQPFLQ